ncbi:MAG: hypothetical protein IKL66_04145 [Clostridia bacterium]|nr:hypothetical protein [Clostridia bacterium]
MFFTKKRTDGKEGQKPCDTMDLIDLHSHVLPCVDDGSESVERSLEMLRFSYDQGVRKIVATPHFYPNMTNPEDFLEKRGRAAEDLAAAVARQRELGEKFPSVCLGAEVAYFDGISRSSAVSDLCILGTKLLIVEMPFERWSETNVGELISLKARGFQPIVAHYDRYCSYQEKGLLDRLLEGGVAIQLNAEAFLRFGTKRQALGMISAGAISFLGSDCHNMTTRMPNLSDAVSVIEKSLGYGCVEELMTDAAKTIESAEVIV